MNTENQIFNTFEIGLGDSDGNSYFEYVVNKYKINPEKLHIQSLQTYCMRYLKDLQNYKIFERSFINHIKLGSGGFGTVYKVEDEWQQYFAVKKIPLIGMNFL